MTRRRRQAPGVTVVVFVLVVATAFTPTRQSIGGGAYTSSRPGSVLIGNADGGYSEETDAAIESDGKVTGTSFNSTTGLYDASVKTVWQTLHTSAKNQSAFRMDAANDISSGTFLQMRDTTGTSPVTLVTVFGDGDLAVASGLTVGSASGTATNGQLVLNDGAGNAASLTPVNVQDLSLNGNLSIDGGDRLAFGAASGVTTHVGLAAGSMAFVLDDNVGAGGAFFWQDTNESSPSTLATLTGTGAFTAEGAISSNATTTTNLQTAANQACTTTCLTHGAAIFAWDSGTTAPVANNSAAADICICLAP